MTDTRQEDVREALAKCLGCIEAAEAEGLHELIVELRGSSETVDRLIDLIDRRLLWVREYATSALSAREPVAWRTATNGQGWHLTEFPQVAEQWRKGGAEVDALGVLASPPPGTK